MNAQQFRNREEAGKLLAEKLKVYKKHPGVFVFGLPRGGVVVAYEAAKALNVQMEVFLVRKLGVPWQPELAMGAIAEGGVTILNEEIVAGLNISGEDIKKVAEIEKKELARRQKLYRGHTAPPVVEGREIILVDDGLATGATMRAAIRALKERKAKKVIVAVPVGDAETCRNIRKEADEVICLLEPHPLEAIGYWYEDFQQVTDQEVLDLLGRSHSQFQLDGYVESEVVKDDKAP